MAFNTNRSRLPAIFSVTRRHGMLVITPARRSKFISAIIVIVAGLALWILAFDPRNDLLLYALATLLLAPGIWLLIGALRPQPIIQVTSGELFVKFGPPLIERTILVFPLDSLEVGVLTGTATAIRYDEDALRARFGSLINPLRRNPPPIREISVYTLQLRHTGQTEWLSVLESQLQSEIENARIAIEDEKAAWTAGTVGEVTDKAANGD